jgi:hypothetical protein
LIEDLLISFFIYVSFESKSTIVILLSIFVVV